VIYDSNWNKSTVTTPSNLSGNWNGINGNLPDTSTYTMAANTGWPYQNFRSLEAVDGADRISTGSDITYFRKEFFLTSSNDLDVRFQMTVDDQSELYINGERITFISSFGADNWRLPAHDVKFNNGMNPQNGFMGNESYNNVTSMDLDNILKTGSNEIVMVVRNLGKPSDNGGFSLRMDVDSCNAVNQQPCDANLITNDQWEKSTVITKSSFSGNWSGASGNLPDDSTFTVTPDTGMAYSTYASVKRVDGAGLIATGNDITYFRKQFNLTSVSDLNVRLRMNVDDQADVYINRERFVLINDFGWMNLRNPAHDVKYTNGGNPQNGFMGGDMYNFVTTKSLDSLFKTGNNEILVVVRNLTKQSDRGGFSLRLEIDSCVNSVNNSANQEANRNPEVSINANSFDNYPNPFTDKTTVSYTIKEDANVNITAFDMTGRQVAVIEDAGKAAGSYNTDWEAERLAPGIYIIKILVNTPGEEDEVSLKKVRKL